MTGNITSYYSSGGTPPAYFGAVWVPDVTATSEYTLATAFYDGSVPPTSVQFAPWTFPNIGAFSSAYSVISASDTGTTTSLPVGRTATTSVDTRSGSGSSSTLTSTPNSTSSNPSGSTTSTTQPPSPNPQPAVAAGIAVGCIIAGIVLGFIAAALLYRRRRTRQDAHYAAAVVEPKPPMSTPSPPAAQQDQLQLSQFILDATPDKELSGEINSLAQLIQHHVENNYHLQPVQTNPAALTQALANFGLDWNASWDVESVVALALDPRTRVDALRHIISFICFSSVEFSPRSRLSMLPAPVAAFLQSIPPVERHGGNVEATSMALSRWRALSAFLLHPQRSQRTPLMVSENAVLQQAAGLANAMNTFLHNFVWPNSAATAAQTDHLQAVILECTKFGYVLFSQPADWRLSHVGSVERSARFLVVCAGLDKVTGGDGRPYAAPRQVVAPALVQF